VQVSAPPGQFTGWIHSYSFARTYDPHHLSFGQHFAASHAGSLGYMLHTVGRFLWHLQFTGRIPPQKRGMNNLFPFIIRSGITALVDLATDNRTETFIKLQGNGLLLALAAFLLITGFIFDRPGILEDFRFHLE